ncbi:hypothetical protein [Chryseobacterium aurantiacum]|uniref:hypothetical protein n=1 Tax=Chryseobacterium aurantiacum TaxID=2116499 RepID=UPI000D1344DC|nr:hypothetical protein [Chryseobacterium aurantiacum]
MKPFIKIISNLFSPKEEVDLKNPPEERLPGYNEKVEVDKYMEIDHAGVKNYEDYLFRTPDEILKIFNNKMLLWVDQKNNLLGFSDSKRSKLFILTDIKGFEIQNMLPAKGQGGSFLSVCLSNGRFSEISEAGVYTFDKYADDLSKITGIAVTFAPEYYNC